MKNLVVLVADKNMEFLIQGLLPRIPDIEQVINFNFDIFIHPHRDSGIVNEADDFLRPLQDKYKYAIVILDHSGCGKENKKREDLENEIEQNLDKCGWTDRACVVVIKPELENWIWVNEVRIKEAISWESDAGIYDWLQENQWKTADAKKPYKPKEAFEASLKECRTPRSSSIYREISSKASYSECNDPAFLKLIAKIKTWFHNSQLF